MRLPKAYCAALTDFPYISLYSLNWTAFDFYELSDWDIVQLSSAEVCIIWGKLESFSDTLTQAETGPAVIAIADDNAEYTLSDELVDYDYYEHFSGENPNSYMSLSHMKIALDSLYHSLCELYPDSAETFTVNYERMVKLMDEASLQLTGLNDGIKHEAVAALFEGAPYILDEIGIEWQYIYPRETGFRCQRRRSH